MGTEQLRDFTLSMSPKGNLLLGAQVGDNSYVLAPSRVSGTGYLHTYGHVTFRAAQEYVQDSRDMTEYVEWWWWAGQGVEE